MSDPPEPRPPREAIAGVRIRVPTRGNRKLEALLDAVNADDQVKAWWHLSAVNATRRLGMSDHSWVHVQIVVNIALRLARLLFRRGVEPSVVVDHGMSAVAGGERARTTARAAEHRSGQFVDFLNGKAQFQHQLHGFAKPI